MPQIDRPETLPQAFQRAWIKVLCMSFTELLAHMGTTRDEMAKHLSPEDAEADRQAAINACMTIVRTCNEPEVRADALDILKEMGVMP